MNINDWIAVYYDESKMVIDTLELMDMPLEEAEELAEENIPDEADSYEVLLHEDYLNNNEDNTDDDYEEEEDVEEDYNDDYDEN
jgi:hypothetical protein